MHESHCDAQKLSISKTTDRLSDRHINVAYYLDRIPLKKNVISVSYFIIENVIACKLIQQCGDASEFWKKGQLRKNNWKVFFFFRLIETF